MGVTLEQLLSDSTGTEKTASADAPPIESDIVDELRKHAEDDNIAIREQAVQELTEKTAEIVVIQKALEEIDKVASLGVASNEHKKLATFIKVALDKGHSEEAIAEFLKKEAVILPTLLGAVGGVAAAKAGSKAYQAGKAALKRRHWKKMEKGISKRHGKVSKLEGATMQDLAKNMDSPAYLKRFSDVHSPEDLKGRLSALAEMGYEMPKSTSKFLPKKLGGKESTPAFTAKTPGGKKISVTSEQAKRYGIPAGYAAGGAAGGKMVFGGSGEGESGKNKSGVVVVNR